MNEELAIALLHRARRLAGVDVKDLMGTESTMSPGKGGVGQYIERALGLSPRFDEVDDPESGVEVKTLPVAFRGDVTMVQQGTFVTSASTDSLLGESWSTSRVRRKLSRVLFVPIVEVGDRAPVDGGRAPLQRLVGTAFLWSPPPDVGVQLRADWEDLSDLVARGLGFAVTARRGVYLQVRPKARDAEYLRRARVVDDDDVLLRPQGFYLRRIVTMRALQEAINLDGTARTRWVPGQTR